MGVRSEAQGPRTVTMLLRGLRLRCPKCGEGKIVSRWFATPDPCLACGQDFNPDGDAAVGWIIVNLGITMMVFFVSAFIGLVLTWPNVPWTGLTIFTLVVNGTLPFVLVPFSRTIWAAIWLTLHHMDNVDVGHAGRVA